MNPYESYLLAHLADLKRLIRELVDCESPSDSPEAIARLVELLIDRTKDIADAKIFSGNHLRLQFRTQATAKEGGQILGLGHSDTVWPLGTLQTMPFREAGGRLWGPGVLDMKAGIAFFVFAVRALLELCIPLKRGVVLLVVSDEEVGSPTSRALTENEARASDAVLVLEPGTGLEGKLKTARKGIGHFEITVTGNASHAGVDFENGASAILELARQIPIISGWTDLQKGITINPGVIRGGTRSNVVPAEAQLEVDVRVKTLADWEIVQRHFRELHPFNKRCSIKVEGGLYRPPMVRSPAGAGLFEGGRTVAEALGFTAEESATGGGSDGNFTAALGVPTLDGLGAVGEGAHAVNESILLSPIVNRVSLLAGLLSRL